MTKLSPVGQATPRALLGLGLVLLWGVRLLHNYLRREGWHFGLGACWHVRALRHTACRRP